MPSTRRRLLAVTAASLASGLALVGCTSAQPTATTAAGATITVTDNHGDVTVPSPATSVVATDNRTFQTLSDWGVELKAAPVDLIATNNPYKTNSSIVNLGMHTEPNLEAIVGVQPDLVINGQRFASHYADIKKLVPDAAVVELDPRDGQPFDAELKRQVTTLGTIFNKANEAKKLTDDFDASIARVKAAYQPSDKVMAVITSGGEINYSAPGSGRTLGPVFSVLGLTPAISTEGTTTDTGDDISVEAIAQSNPDWILVLDRDAAISARTEGTYKPANELITNSAALKNVSAVKEGRVIYMPQDTYLNEGIQTYTAFFNSVADAMEKGN